MIAFPELMEAITILHFLNNKTNDLLIGTRKGSLAIISFQYTNEKVIERMYNVIMKVEEEIVDIIPHLNQSILVCTKKKVILIHYKLISEGTVKILEKKKLFETDSEIVQVNASETRILVSTWKSYFIVNIFGEECVQVGSKEKQGIYGSTFFQDEDGK